MQTKNEVLDTLQRFVAGETTPTDFRDLLYASVDAYEQLLENDPDLSRSNYVDGSTFQFILSCEFDDPGDVLNAQGAICDYFDRNQFEYKKSDQYSKLHNAILSASPKWLDPDLKYVKEHILTDAGERQGKELKSWLSAELKKHFRYMKKPLRWIQGPNWPHGKTGPMVFMGQLEIENYFHDAASVYVFYDESTGETETLIQCY